MDVSESLKFVGFPTKLTIRDAETDQSVYASGYSKLRRHQAISSLARRFFTWPAPGTRASLHLGYCLDVDALLMPLARNWWWTLDYNSYDSAVILVAPDQSMNHLTVVSCNQILCNRSCPRAAPSTVTFYLEMSDHVDDSRLSKMKISSDRNAWESRYDRFWCI